MTGDCSSAVLELFPPLAVELVRYILEAAAEDHKLTSFMLSLVSKTVHK
jgi:hypothetical protein